MTKFPIGLYVDSGKTMNYISTNMQVFLNPRKSVPTKINEFTVYDV